jgi:four helix bundle protein
LETQLIIIDELLLISKKAEIAELVNDINKIQKMINNLITKLKANYLKVE